MVVSRHGQREEEKGQERLPGVLRAHRRDGGLRLFRHDLRRPGLPDPHRLHGADPPRRRLPARQQARLPRPACRSRARSCPASRSSGADIVVFKYPKDLTKDFVKRVIALEGEKVEVKDKQVLVNDKPLDEAYKVHIDSHVNSKSDFYNYEDVIRDNYGPVTVPPGHCFVMGDNRDNSMDSRYWGFVPLASIKGKPWVIYFSYKAERDAWQKTGFRDRVKKIVSFIPKARWGRMLRIIN